MCARVALSAANDRAGRALALNSCRVVVGIGGDYIAAVVCKLSVDTTAGTT